MSNDATKYFAPTIFPNFPFADPTWIAVGFDRDNYDNTRFPLWFFSAIRDGFNADQSITIRPAALKGQEQQASTFEVDFSWAAYSRFMLDRENYASSYKGWNASGDWAFWSDTGISVWGGANGKMSKVVENLGGRDRVVEIMLKDFAVEDRDDAVVLRDYVRRLLFR